MDDQIKKFLYKKIEDIKGLSAIIISDREGVPVIKVCLQFFNKNQSYTCIKIIFLFIGYY